MAQVHVNPEELKRFAQHLKQFTSELRQGTTILKGQFQQLGATWKDQEHQKFAQEFQNTVKTIERFLQIADPHIPFLLRKAEQISAYFSQTSTINDEALTYSSQSTGKHSLQVKTAIQEGLKEGEKHGTFMMKGKAAEQVVLLHSHGTSLDDLIQNNHLASRKDHFFIFDIGSQESIISVKVKGIHLEGENIAGYKLNQSAKTAYLNAFYDIIGEGSNESLLEEAAALLFEAKNKRLIQIPDKMKNKITVAAIKDYLCQYSELRIPDEHVDEIRELVKAKIQKFPDNFGLKGTVTEKQIHRLLERIQPIGVTLYEIEQQYEKYIKNGRERS